MEKVKVEIQQGVYVDLHGDLIVIEFGEIENDTTKVRDPGLKVTSLKPGTLEEISILVNIGNPTDLLVDFCKFIRFCEYLGEL